MQLNKLGLLNDFDVDFDTLEEKLNNAKMILDDKKESFIALFYDGGLPSEAGNVVDFLVLTGIEENIISAKNAKKLVVDAITILNENINNYVNTWYDLTGYKLYLKIDLTFGGDILLVMKKN